MPLTITQAVERLKENEERLDQFINSPTGYTDSTGQPVESVPAFLERVEQAARDATIVSSNMYPDEATGRAAVADGAYFRVVGSGDVASYEYRRINASTSTQVASYPSAQVVEGFRETERVAKPLGTGNRGGLIMTDKNGRHFFRVRTDGTVEIILADVEELTVDKKIIGEKTQQITTTISRLIWGLLDKNGRSPLGVTRAGDVHLGDAVMPAKSALSRFAHGWADRLGRVMLGVTKTGSLTLGDHFVPAKSMYGSAWAWGIADKNGRIAIGVKRDGSVVIAGDRYQRRFNARGNRVFHIGDSITANGIAADAFSPFTQRPPAVNAKCWGAHAMMESDCIIEYVGSSATGGYSVTQILNEHLPRAIAAKPDYCVVHCGRNDVWQTAINLDTVTLPALAKIYLALLEAQIVPVLCVMAVHGVVGLGDGVLQRQRENKINNFIRGFAEAFNLPLVDLHAATVDPITGNWIAGYAEDVSHPTELGAKVMGARMAQDLVPWLSPRKPRRLLSTSSPENLLTNSLFQTSASGIPTGFNVATAFTTSAVAADAAIRGNAWTVSSADTTVRLAYQTISVTAGKRYALSFKFKPGVYDPAQRFTIALAAGDYAASQSAGATFLGGIYNWRCERDWSSFYFEVVVPEGFTQATMLVSARLGTMSVAELAVFEIIEVQ